MASRSPADAIPPEALLADSTPPIREIAERLRRVVRSAVPDAIERVRPGWGLIGYDLPIRRRTVFFAWVWPEGPHVHLGFPHGDLMDDPRGVLHGAGVTKRARWLTFEPGDPIDEAQAADLVVEAAKVAVIPRSA
jgi:hypothetical protein